MKGMEITILSERLLEQRGYRGATLFLPATQAAIADAAYRARMEEGEKVLVECYGEWPKCVQDSLEDMGGGRIEEINLLAHQISQMDEFQKEAYEGAVTLWEEGHKDEQITLKELINLAYNLDCYEYRPGVVDDLTLGNIALENELLDTVSNLPEAVLDLLDPKKVGQEMRYRDGGIFTHSGYVFSNHIPHQEFYDGMHLPELFDMPKGILAVQIVSIDRFDEKGVWLEFPVSEQEKLDVLKRLQEPSFDSCVIKESIGTALNGPLAGDEDIDKLNTLVRKILKFPDQKAFAKYKAALELELCRELDKALDIEENLECYNYDPRISSPIDYAEALLKAAGIDPDDPAFSAFDFQGYGERQMRRSGYVQTEYGLISRNETPFVAQYKQTNQMKMGGYQ